MSQVGGRDLSDEGPSVKRPMALATPKKSLPCEAAVLPQRWRLETWRVVGADGLALRFEGTIWYTWDANANALTQFGYKGTVTNVCDLLS